MCLGSSFPRKRESGDWTFFGVAKPTLGARASRLASRPQLWPQAIGAASGCSEAGGTPALPGCHPGCLRQTHASCRVSAFRQRNPCLVTALHRPRSQQPKSRRKTGKNVQSPDSRESGIQPGFRLAPRLSGMTTVSCRPSACARQLGFKTRSNDSNRFPDLLGASEILHLTSSDSHGW